MITRRRFFATSGAATGAATGAMVLTGSIASMAQAKSFEISRSAAEWKAVLSPAQYRILREEGTEPAGSSPLNAEKRAGIYHCAGCDLALYSSETKYESGTGWPSFWEPLDNAVATKRDWKLVIPRTEVHCRRCGGHLGHVFSDGPQPTGKRHCLNGLSLVFKPA